MANLGEDGFDDNDTGGFEPVPDGTYSLIATESSLEENSKGTGQLLKFSFEIIDGEFKGRKIWEQFNWTHSKAQVQEIGRQRLAAFRNACGLSKILNSEELHNLPFNANIRIEESPGYSPKNVISQYLPKAPTAGEKRGRTTSDAASPGGSETANRPWAK